MDDEHWGPVHGTVPQAVADTATSAEKTTTAARNISTSFIEA
jgi:hypothetical protein